MPSAIVSRLPSVRSLSEILPSGTEGGKEFARIVDLLLINEARLTGDNLTVFDDAAGDYEALDSFSRITSTGKRTGYQYKFLPSPLSPSHRSEITKSLQAAVEKSKNSKITRWVIVTPDDFMHSARRKDDTDLRWFEKLQNSSSEL